MKTVIAGTDFTKSSLNACNYAAMLAKRSNAKLVLFNLYDVPILHSNSGIYFIAFDSEKESHEKKMKNLIANLKNNFPGIEVEFFLRTGSFEKEIKKFIKTRKVLALVMGLATKTKLSKFIYGSHSTDIAGKLSVPVIIVPDQYKKHKIQNLVLAVSTGEKLKKFSLDSFSEFLNEFGINLRVIHVRTEDEVILPEINPAIVNGKNYKIEMVEAKDLETGVKVFSKKNSIDIASIISKKHSLFFDLFYETNTKKLVFASRLPVMAIHE